MSSFETVIQKYSIKFKQAYNKHKLSNQNQYVSTQQLQKWLFQIFLIVPAHQLTNYQAFQSKCKQSFNQLVKEYLKQVHNLDENNIKSPQFKYQECIDFLNWLVQQKFTNQQNNNEQDNQNQIVHSQQQQHEQYEQIKQNKSKLSNSIQGNNSKLSNRMQKNNSNITKKSNKQNNQLKRSKLHQQQQHNNQHQHQHQQIDQIKNNQNNYFHQNQNNYVHQNQNNQLHQQNDFINQQQANQKVFGNNKQQKNKRLNLQQLQQKYKQYLDVIFQHYCKLTNASKQQGTFQAIQKKITIMNMNNFMIFSKDFDLGTLVSTYLSRQSGKQKQKISKTAIRNQLMQIFKKNSQFYKQMVFQQFLQMLHKIGIMVFSKMKQIQTPQQITQTQKLSYQMIKILQFMQISTFKDFKQKMNKLHINYQNKTNKQVLQKKVPNNYKFKFQPASIQKDGQQNNMFQGTNVQRNRLVMNRNNNGSQNKQKQRQRSVKQYALDLKKQKKQSNYKISQNSIRLTQKNIDKNQQLKRQSNQKTTLSTKNLRQGQSLRQQSLNFRLVQSKTKNNLNLAPLIPPPRKVSNVITNMNNSSSVPAGLVGYARIHKAKKGVLKQIQDPINYQTPGSVSRKKGDFQLNNIVQQARNIVYYDQTQSRSGRVYSNSTSNKAPSLYSRDGGSSFQNYPPSRDQQYLNQFDQINRHNQHYMSRKNNSIIMEQNSRVKVDRQLNGLIDLNDSDQDQYLVQHFKKQQQGDQIKKRIDKKISMLSSSPLQR